MPHVDEELLIDAPEEANSLWREEHRKFAMMIAQSPAARETATAEPGAASLDERLVQAVWFDQMLRGADLTTASGRRIEVLEPGRWNTSRGPDFLDARLRLAGEVVTGDIEIHIRSADWTNHGHHQNFEYNRTILHAFLNANDDRPYDEKQNGERLERLVLTGYLEPDIDTIRGTINLGDYPYGRPAYLGLCHEQFLRLPEKQLLEFLYIAGRSRMEGKIARYQAQLNTADPWQVIYQALMTAQGFKSSKTLYFLLSKRAPLAELIDIAQDFPPEDRADFFLSVLLNVGQVLPAQANFLTDADEETRQYHARLERFWHAARPYFSDRLIPPTKRWYAGMRPAGFPTRRLAAVSILLGRLTDKESPLFQAFQTRIASASIRGMKPKERRKYLKELLQDLPVDGDEHYFGTHFTLGGKKGRPQALLGEPAARSLAFNVLLPLAVLSARRKKDKQLERNCWHLIQEFPALERNSIVRFMERRLFGESGAAKGLLKREIFQQAFLKVFADCCAQNERTCDDCTFYSLARQMQNEQTAGIDT